MLMKIFSGDQTKHRDLSLISKLII